MTGRFFDNGIAIFADGKGRDCEVPALFVFWVKIG